MYKNIRINITEEELQDLMNGKSFDWTFDGVGVHLFMGEEDEE